MDPCPPHRYDVHRVPSSLAGPVDPSFRALFERLKFTVRRNKFNEDSLSVKSCSHRPHPDRADLHAPRAEGAKGGGDRQALVKEGDVLDLRVMETLGGKRGLP